MSFHSSTFAAFLAATAALYYLAPPGRRLQVLLAGSVLFYVSFVPQHIILLAGLIVIDYFAALLIERAQSANSKRGWLALSLTTNLAFMALFKYGPSAISQSLGAMPLGLSFHTFQAMAYTMDVYRGRQPAERSFSNYALYILFFPKIVAGPIERPQSLLAQFRTPHRFTYENTVAGLQLMMWGMFQKFVIADRLAECVNAVYANSSCSGPVVAFAAVCYSFQILCDFGGYSDIAIGAAQVLGFRLMRNFNSPFHADSMAEYWKRWHISLSSWMRDYIFFPLCGKRPRMWRVSGSIIVVFLANGIWHGARWTYLVSGLLHGVYRVVELLAGRALSRADWQLHPRWNRPLRVARTLLVFSLMTFAFIFFRSGTLSYAFGIISRLFSGWEQLGSIHAIAREWAKTGMSPSYFLVFAGMILLIEAVQVLKSFGPLRPRIAALPFWCRWSLYYAVTAAVLLFAQQQSQAFLYARF